MHAVYLVQRLIISKMANILRPQIVKVDGKSYRKMSDNRKRVHERDRFEGDDHDIGYVNWEDEECNPFDGIIETGSGQFKATIDIPSALFKFICGRKMEMKRRIEKDTNTRIDIPPPGKEKEIVITGQGKSGVRSAKNRIEMIAESNRQKLGYTHFISFPLIDPHLHRSMEDFKSKALEQCGKEKGVDPSIFQKPPKLHLTVGMLSLLNEKEIQKAADILEASYKNLLREHVGDNPLLINLHGVSYMNDDPADVKVLYANVLFKDQTDRLQQLAEALVETFASHGLMQREYDRVKLHATVMNAGFREESAKEEETSSQSSREVPHTAGPGQEKNLISFDARKIVELFCDFDFGDYHVDCIHLCQRGVYNENGNYHCEKSVPLP